MLPHLQHVMHKKGVLSICLHQKANLNLNWPLNWKKTGLDILSHGLMLMLSVFVSQEIHLASLGGDGHVKDNVYRDDRRGGTDLQLVGQARVEGRSRQEEREVSGHKPVSCC